MDINELAEEIAQSVENMYSVSVERMDWPLSRIVVTNEDTECIVEIEIEEYGIYARHGKSSSDSDIVSEEDVSMALSGDDEALDSVIDTVMYFVRNMPPEEYGLPSEHVIVENMPEWALPYLVNGDTDGLTDEDLNAIDEWLDDTGFHEIVNVLDGTRGFSSHPAFGLACDTVSVIMR